jgi:hypothetical protein
MARTEWVKLGTKNCDVVGHEVELMEKRVYPAGLLDADGEGYRVLMRKCSAGYQCGHMEDPCQWAEVGHDGRQYNE